MPSLIILRGLPASGKTTYAREWCEEHPNYKRISKDDLRAMLDDGHYTPRNEYFIKHAQRVLIVAAFTMGKSVILDNTNIDADEVLELRDFGHDLGIGVVLKDIEVEVDECIMRDARREKPVGAHRIIEMNEQLEQARSRLYKL